MNYAVTGHRSIKDGDRSKIQDRIRKIVRTPDAESIYFGGALGTDSLALEEANNARDGSFPELIVVVPWAIKDQPNEAVKVIKGSADRVIELDSDAPVGRGRGYFERNQELVDRADQLLAFWSGKEGGGTYKTLEYARSDDDTKITVIDLNGKADG